MTGCVSYFAATLTPYVRFSTSFVFHEDSFQMNCYALLPGIILFMAHKKILLTGNSWNLFLRINTVRPHFPWSILRLQYFCCISSGSYGLVIIASLNKYFFLGILNRRMGIKEQDYEECKTVKCLINLGPVHTYPEIFVSANFFMRIQKYLRPHVAYTNRIRPSTRIRFVSGHLKGLVNRACALQRKLYCDVSVYKNIRIRASTRIRIHSVYRNLRIHRAYTADTCGR